MTRSYTLKRRAEQQAETRLRIVEAAVDLHGRIGPAATTVSLIAEEAGVQRHTVYAHFPDDRSLYMACSALALERSPLPDAETWRAVADSRARLATGLRELYAWYEHNAGLAACVLRDAEWHALTRDIVDIRIKPSMQRYADVLGAGLDLRGRAMLHLALGFPCWRALVRESGLSTEAAADVMAQTVTGITG